MSNLLITSISRKISLLKNVRQTLNIVGKDLQLFGADTASNCIGSYFVDYFWQIPQLDQLSIESLIDYCEKNQIKFIIPTRDGELLYFASHKDQLIKHGIQVMVSDLNSVELCLDKYKFANHLSKLGYPVINTIVDINEDSFQYYVVKERFGAGSSKIALNVSKEDALMNARKLDSPVFQPYISGKEYSIDVYVDRKGKVRGAIVRCRDYVVNGESQITTTIRDQKLEKMISQIAVELGIYGHAVFQAIIDDEGNYHIIECNCRFGGASTLSLAAGLDSFYWFLLEASNHELDLVPFNRSEQEKKLIRYPEDLIL